MSKHNQAPLRMVVEGNRLSPASAFDQERLDSYTRGSVIEVYFWQGRNGALSRKYWSILSRAVKDCPTQWQSADEANDALKLALGITDIGKTVNGQWFIRPGSISFASMDEAKFREFFESAMAMLQKITGVDPLTLGKEAADTGETLPEHDLETGELTGPQADSSPSDNDANSPASSDGPVVQSYSPATGPTLSLPDDVRARLMEFAGKMVRTLRDPDLAKDNQAKLDVILKSEASFRDAIDQSFWPKLSTLRVSGETVVSGKWKIEQAIDFMAEMLDCDVKAIGAK